ncbi:Neurochondrin-domain-containing protein [Biscogniauxia marginata]|nr:Neurochondrin-domain-containing protein [Biscogniauxia marginata]
MDSPTESTLIPRHVRDPVQRIKPLLKAKDDTSRFVGLTLLKQALDTYPELQADKVEIASLWRHISPKFLDRLLHTGTRVVTEQNHAREMLDFAVGVIRAFTILQPKFAIGQSYFERIPKLSAALVYSTKETTQNIVDIVLALVQDRPNAKTYRGAAFMAKLDVNTWNLLIEVTPDHHDVFAIFHWTWLKGTAGLEDQKVRNEMRDKIDAGLQSFVSSFKGSPSADLLIFITGILRGLDSDLIPPTPGWLESVVILIKKMSFGKQSEKERRAYTTCAATLLLVYPHQAPQLLFSDDPNSSKPFAYFLITMLQVDFHSTVHLLLPMTKESNYLKVSQRLASALEVVSAFLVYLIGTIDDEDQSNVAKTARQMRVTISPDNILKIRTDIARTIAEAMEYLRDRWDAVFLANRNRNPRTIAQSQHPPGEATEKLAWDVTEFNLFEDPITPAAVGLISIWLRDDDGAELRKQGANLMDVLVELYQRSVSSSPDNQKIRDLRMPILSALEGILETTEGIEMANAHDLWSFLSFDLRNILQASANVQASADVQNGADVQDSVDVQDSANEHPLTTIDYLRGRFICQTLQTILNHESNTRQSWLKVADDVALYKVPPIEADAGDELVKTLLEFQIDALQIAAELLRKVTPHLKITNIKTVECLKDVAASMTRQWNASDNQTLQTVKQEVDSL